MTTRTNKVAVHHHTSQHKHSVGASHTHKHTQARDSSHRLWWGTAPAHPVAVLNLPCVESKNCCSASPCTCSYSCACVDNKQDQAGGHAPIGVQASWVLCPMCAPPLPCEGTARRQACLRPASLVTCMPSLSKAGQGAAGTHNPSGNRPKHNMNTAPRKTSDLYDHFELVKVLDQV